VWKKEGQARTRTFDSRPELVLAARERERQRLKRTAVQGMRRLIFSKVTANWRAGYKKFGSPVRDGGAKAYLSYPYVEPESTHQQTGE